MVFNYLNYPKYSLNQFQYYSQELILTIIR